jgi:hypothetical protein
VKIDYHKLEGYDVVCQVTINVGNQSINLFVDFPSSVNNEFLKSLDFIFKFNTVRYFE